MGVPYWIGAQNKSLKKHLIHVNNPCVVFKRRGVFNWRAHEIMRDLLARQLIHSNHLNSLCTAARELGRGESNHWNKLNQPKHTPLFYLIGVPYLVGAPINPFKPFKLVE